MGDFFDAKADVEALLWPVVPDFVRASHAALHPGQAARVSLDGADIGWIGALHPKWVQQYDLPQAPVLFELDLGMIFACPLPRFSELPKFPAVRRDRALIFDETLSVQTILDSMLEERPQIVTEVVLFDVHRGKGIDLGKKSLAFRITLQDTQKTLTDAEVDAAVSHLTQILETRFNAKLRI